MLISDQACDFTIGICASDASEKLPELLSLIESEKFPNGFVLQRLVIVASGCQQSTLRNIDSFVAKDKKLYLIKESERHGKAEAINKIIRNKIGDYLVLANADTLPAQGAIGKILSSIQASSSIGIVSGSPFFEERPSPTSSVEHLMWEIHNECSSKLNHAGISNHGNDELMVIRSAIIKELPEGIVNDGAYMAGKARLDGFSIKFCNEARVLIDVPTRITDLIRQRRRIIVGHFQVWQLTGKSPKTVESLLLFAPLTSLGIVVRILARYPKLIRIVPLAIVSEATAFFFAARDVILRSNKKHSIWERYAN